MEEAISKSLKLRSVCFGCLHWPTTKCNSTSFGLAPHAHHTGTWEDTNSTATLRVLEIIVACKMYCHGCKITIRLLVA